MRAEGAAWAGVMIKGILVINNHGKPRLTKFYEHLVSACARCGQLRPHEQQLPRDDS